MAWPAPERGAATRSPLTATDEIARMSQPAAKTEIRQLTALRGIAALLVVLYHFRKEFGDTIRLDSFTQFFACGYVWVDFFFALSGFVIEHVYGGYLSPPLRGQTYLFFLVKRLARIYPLHVFTFALFVPTEAAKLLLPSNAAPAFSVNTPAAMLSNLFLVQAWHLHASATWNQPAWSISAEWAAYLLTPFLLIIVRETRPLPAILLAALLCAALYGSGAYLGRGSLDMTSDYGVVRCVISFTLGLLIQRLNAQGSRRLKTLVGNDASVTAAVLSVLLAMHVHAPDWIIASLFCWILAAAAMRGVRHAHPCLAAPSLSGRHFILDLPRLRLDSASVAIRLVRLRLTHVRPDILGRSAGRTAAVYGGDRAPHLSRDRGADPRQPSALGCGQVVACRHRV